MIRNRTITCPNTVEICFALCTASIRTGQQIFYNMSPTLTTLKQLSLLIPSNMYQKPHIVCSVLSMINHDLATSSIPRTLLSITQFLYCPYKQTDTDANYQTSAQLTLTQKRIEWVHTKQNAKLKMRNYHTKLKNSSSNTLCEVQYIQTNMRSQIILSSKSSLNSYHVHRQESLTQHTQEDLHTMNYKMTTDGK